MSDADAHAPLGARLREKLPEILIEAGSVVLALLLAFAINDWHDRRQDDERAAIAKQAILGELRANAGELETTRAALKPILEDLHRAIDVKEAEPHELKINLGISLLSSAAWHAALATQASQRIDFDWMTRVAKVYELQDNFQRVQNAAIDQLTTLPPQGGPGARQLGGMLMPRYSALAQLGDSLAASYADVLARASVQDSVH